MLKHFGRHQAVEQVDFRARIQVQFQCFVVHFAPQQHPVAGQFDVEAVYGSFQEGIGVVSVAVFVEFGEYNELCAIVQQHFIVFEHVVPDDAHDADVAGFFDVGEGEHMSGEVGQVEVFPLEGVHLFGKHVVVAPGDAVLFHAVQLDIAAEKPVVEQQPLSAGVEQENTGHGVHFGFHGRQAAHPGHRNAKGVVAAFNGVGKVKLKRHLKRRVCCPQGRMCSKYKQCRIIQCWGVHDRLVVISHKNTFSCFRLHWKQIDLQIVFN